MAHFEIEKTEPTPEEKELQHSIEKKVTRKEVEASAKDIIHDKKMDKVFDDAKEAEEPEKNGFFNYKDKKTEVKQSLFYPLAQALNDYLTKQQLHIEPANDDEREALKQATLELEVKYGANKINSPETRFLVAEVTPFIRQFDKIMDRVREKRKTRVQDIDLIIDDKDLHAEDPLPNGFIKTNPIQYKKSD